MPNLRFPEFEGEWDRYKLEDIATFLKDRVSSSTLTKDNYVSTENILQDFQGVIRSQGVPANFNVMVYKKGDILISNIRPYLKKVWKADRDGGCSADVFVMRANKTLCNEGFLHHIIANDCFIAYVMSGAKGVKMPRGDKEQMKKYKTSLPSIAEQKKISSLLNLIDERIATQNRIIEKYESLIKGIAKQLAKHTPNTRIADCVECHSSTLQENQLDGEGIYKVYGANGLCGYTKTPSISGDSILIVKDGSGVGNVSYVNGDYSVIGTSNYLTAKESFSLRYIYYCLMVFNFQPYKTGMAIPHIYFKDYGKAKIYCPKREQQENIAAILYIIEHKINMEKSIKDLFISQKKYLLRSMFK